MEDKIKNNIIEIMKHISSLNEPDNSLINELKQLLIDSKLDFSDADIFSSFLISPMEDIFSNVIFSLYNIDNVINKNKISFLFLHYYFLDSHISKLCIQKDGYSCSSDKSNFIIHCYLKYLLNNNFPSFEKEKKHIGYHLLVQIRNG